MESEKLIAIPYLRFSSDRQAQGSSYERQQSMIAKWLQDHPEYALSPMRFEDLGVSGWSGEHLENGFGKLLAAIKSGHIEKGNVVLVEAIDRMGRLEPMDMIPLLSGILKNGVNIITLDDGTEYTRTSANGQHLFLLAAKVQQANLFSENLSRRISDSWKSRRKKADNGEAIKKRLPVWLSKDNQLREDIAPIIVEAFELYASGWGERRIRGRIKERCTNESGTILYPELHKVSPAGVQSWWDMRTAIGYWNDTPNVHPAVIPMELWVRVQQERARRFTGPRLAAPSKHTLTGLIKCGRCGNIYRAKVDKGKSPVMTCGHRARLGGDACSNGKAIPVDVLEAVMMFTCLDYIKKAVISEQPSLNVKKLAEIEFRLGEIHKQLKSLADTIALTGAIDELVSKAKELSEEKTTLEYERTILSSEKEDLSYLDLANIEADFLLNDPMRLNALLQKVGYAINIFADGLMYVDITDPFKYEGYDRKADKFKLRRTLEGTMLVSKGNEFTKAYRQQWLEMDKKENATFSWLLKLKEGLN